VKGYGREGVETATGLNGESVLMVIARNRGFGVSVKGIRSKKEKGEDSTSPASRDPAIIGSCPKNRMRRTSLFNSQDRGHHHEPSSLGRRGLSKNSGTPSGEIHLKSVSGWKVAEGGSSAAQKRTWEGALVGGKSSGAHTSKKATSEEEEKQNSETPSSDYPKRG